LLLFLTLKVMALIFSFAKVQSEYSHGPAGRTHKISTKFQTPNFLSKITIAQKVMVTIKIGTKKGDFFRERPLHKQKKFSVSTLY